MKITITVRDTWWSHTLDAPQPDGSCGDALTDSADRSTWFGISGEQLGKCTRVSLTPVRVRSGTVSSLWEPTSRTLSFDTGDASSEGRPARRRLPSGTMSPRRRAEPDRWSLNLEEEFEDQLGGFAFPFLFLSGEPEKRQSGGYKPGGGGGEGNLVVSGVGRFESKNQARYGE